MSVTHHKSEGNYPTLPRTPKMRDIWKALQHASIKNIKA